MKIANKLLKWGKCQCRAWDLSHTTWTRIPTAYQLPDLGKTNLGETIAELLWDPYCIRHINPTELLFSQECDKSEGQAEVDTQHLGYSGPLECQVCFWYNVTCGNHRGGSGACPELIWLSWSWWKMTREACMDGAGWVPESQQVGMALISREWVRVWTVVCRPRRVQPSSRVDW